MSRYSASGAYGFHIQKINAGDFIISWTVDRYYKGSRLRWPWKASRYTDLKGAQKFCKKHDLEMPQ